MKDARLSLPLAEVIKIARLTSPLFDVPHQSPPRPRLSHGRQFALLFRPNLTLNLYIFLFALSLAYLTRLPSLLTSPNCSSPRELASVYAAYLRFYFFVSQPQTLRSRTRDYLSELRRATCPEESHSSFCSLFSPAKFLAAASNLSSSIATGLDKIAHPMLNHFSRSHRFFSSYFQSFLDFAFLSFHLENIFYYSHSRDRKACQFFCFLSALSPPASQSVLNASFYPVYSLSGS